MAVRNEAVRFTAIDDFSGPVSRMAAALALANRELHSLSGESVKSSAVSRTLSRDLDEVNRKSTGVDRSINQLTGRLRLFADAAAVLGPAFVPIGAIAVPAVTGLANELGVAALAAGTAVVAFQGVGTALEAVNKAHLDPTAKNLEAAREALEKLSPTAQALVGQLQGLRPALTGLRDAAAEGMFPGLMRGIDALESRLPDVERIITNVSETLGGMLAGGGASLASGRWDNFFDFLATDATDTLRDLGQTVGSLTHGLAEMWMAFDPLNDDFSGWLRDVASGFDEWAQGLDQTEGFQEFVDYVRTNGPKVADAMGALGDALLQVVEAAAPLGGPTLQAIEAVADVIATIADSNLGTPLLALASLNAIAGRMAPVMMRLGAGFEMVASSSGRAGINFARMRSGLAGAAAPLAGIGIAMSGIGQNTEYANTAMLGSAGLMMGPWGGALGAAAGLTLDLASANDDLEQALKRTNDAMSGNDFTAMRQSVAALNDEYQKYLDGINRPQDADAGNIFEAMGLGIKNMATDPLATIRGISDAFTHESEKMNEQRRETIELLNRMGPVTSKLAKQLGAEGMFGESSPGAMASFEDRMAALERAQPIMERMGVTLEDLANMGGVQRMSLIGQIADEVQRLDSTEGRIDNVSDAVAGLDNALLSGADSAQAFSSALDALLDPQFNLSEATDQWHAGLQHLNDELSKNGRSLRGQTDVARENRAVIRDRVTDYKDILKAEAEAGASSEELTKKLRTQRKALIDAGVAAGLSRADLTAYLKTLGLTPKMVRTIVETVGTEKAKSGIVGLIGDMNNLDKKTANPKVTANTSQARSALGGIVGLLDRIQSKSVNVNVTQTGVRGMFSAEGNIFPSVRSFGVGGLDRANAHLPEIASGGTPYRVWAEPETGGESYIPHANDYRRPRARSILEQTASILGGSVEWYANGGGTIQAAHAVRQRIPARTTSGTQRVIVEGHITGTVDTPYGPARMEGQIRQIAREEISANEAWEGGLDR